ncbi:MAG TPA: hypothetical protein VJR23_13785 [Candidatus Acidoferrales bacterium]|nr:hypothetical protein [Candidatus Acidoferrales bacterium]
MDGAAARATRLKAHDFWARASLGLKLELDRLPFLRHDEKPGLLPARYLISFL